MWLKIFVFLVGAASVISSSGPRHLHDTTFEYIEDEIAIEPLVDPIDGFSFRLPNDTFPLTYDIWLSTNIHRGDFAFDGRAVIRFQVVDTTSTVTLNYRQMTVQRINLLDANNQLIQENVNWAVNDTLQHLIISPFILLPSGQQFAVQIFYNNTIRADSLGFYRGSYINPQGETVWLAATQFQANEARTAFPCYDEPRRRSLFTIAIRHDASYIALSNMPVTSRVVEPGTNYVLTSFAPTLSMQTYLVAFTVSNYLFVENSTVVPPQRIYGKPQSILNREGDYALESTIDLTAEFERYLQIPYSFPKLDQFACPAFAFAAMENWGLAMYAEPFLLWDPITDRTRDQENVFVVISHELAHMWFGNLVSPSWWTYLWINEGFAIQYEFYIPHLVHPQRRYLDSFYTNYQRTAMEADANPNIRAMTTYVENPVRIMSLFDIVAYNKAGSVFFMIQHALGDPTWRKGLNYFLIDRQYNYTNSHHLYSNIQRAVLEDMPLNPVNVAQVMTTWELQPGLPVITVSRNENLMTFYQERFFYDNRVSANLWWVPINYVVGSNPNFIVTTPDLWLGHRLVTIQSNTAPKPWTINDWIVVNIQTTGYYRVNYDNNLWNLLIQQLNSAGFAQIHFLNRGQLIDDSFHIARSGRINFGTCLDIFNYLERETDHVPWALAFRASTFLNRWLIGTPVYSDYQAFVRKNVATLYNRLGINIIPNELRVDRYARAIAINLACEAGSEQCLTEASQMLNFFITTGNRIAPDLTQTIYCNGLRRGNSASVTFMQNELLQTVRQRDRNFIISGLGCIGDAELLTSQLFMAVRRELNLSNAERTNILLSPLNHGEASLQVMMNFIRIYYGGINLINPNLVSTLCNNIAARVSSERMLLEFTSLLNHLEINGVLERTGVNAFRISATEILQWQAQNMYFVIDFFRRRPPAVREF